MMARREDPPLPTVGFAGPGDVTEENVKDLLNRGVPESLNKVYVPSKILRKHRGMREVLGWLTNELGPDGFHAVDDVVAALSDADDALLIFIPGEDLTDDDVDLLRRAEAASIPVQDLTQGLDDFDYAAVPVAEPELPEDEAEAEPPARTRRTRSARTTQDTQPAQATTEPRRRGRAREIKAEVDAEEHTAVEHEPDGTRAKPATMEDVTDDREDTSGIDAFPETWEELIKVIDARVSKILFDASKALTSPRSPGRPRADGTPAQPRGERTYAFIKLDDGTYKRRGRGKPRPGQEIVELTQEEAEARGLM